MTKTIDSPSLVTHPVASAADREAVKLRQRATWAAGDYASGWSRTSST